MKASVNNGAEIRLTGREWRRAKWAIRAAIGLALTLSGNAIRTEFALAACLKEQKVQAQRISDLEQQIRSAIQMPGNNPGGIADGPPVTERK